MQKSSKDIKNGLSDVISFLKCENLRHSFVVGFFKQHDDFFLQKCFCRFSGSVRGF